MELIPREQKPSNFLMRPLDKVLKATGMWAYPLCIEPIIDSQTGNIKLEPHYQIIKERATSVQALNFSIELSQRTKNLLGTLNDLRESST